MEKVIISFLPSYLICIDDYKPHYIKGRIYCGEESFEHNEFTDVNQLLIQIEKVMEAIQYPAASINHRGFIEEKKRIVVDKAKKREAIKKMRKFNLESKNGEKATFVLEVKFRKNASWQGTVKWVEKKQEINFRSALELIKIIDGACAQGYEVNMSEEESQSM